MQTETYVQVITCLLYINSNLSDLSLVLFTSKRTTCQTNCTNGKAAGCWMFLLVALIAEELPNNFSWLVANQSSVVSQGQPWPLVYVAVNQF